MGVANQKMDVHRSIGENSANNVFDSSQVAANADGSVLERLEYIAGTFTTYTKADVTAATAWTTGNSPVTVFTVTGTVMLRLMPYVTVAFTSTSSTGTLALGTSDNASSITAATTANGTNFAAGDVWTTTTTTKGNVLANTGNWLLVRGTETVTVTIGTNSMTAGGMVIICQWIPLTSGASVVAATT